MNTLQNLRFKTTLSAVLFSIIGLSSAQATSNSTHTISLANASQAAPMAPQLPYVPENLWEGFAVCIDACNDKKDANACTMSEFDEVTDEHCLLEEVSGNSSEAAFEFCKAACDVAYLRQ